MSRSHPSPRSPATRPRVTAAARSGRGAARASGGTASRAPARSPARGAEKPTDKREAILGAALELFVERGFFGTAVPEIADRAAVGAGTIYRYFDSKEALVNAIYRQEKSKFAQACLADLPTSASTREQFRLLWHRMATYATAHPSAFIFLELHHHARYLDDESRALEQRLTELFTAIVTRAQSRRELKPGVPRLLMGLVMGAFVGVIRSCVEVDQSLGDADWAFAEQCVWEAIRA